jgi:signal transduction histidine kinase
VPDASTVSLVVALHDAWARSEAAAQLAARLGVEHVLLLVRDPALDALLPAPGFPRTLRGGPTWRAFVSRCLAAGRHEDEVEFPLGTQARARAVVSDGVALVLIGGAPIAAELAVVNSLLPLLSATLRAEQRAELDRAMADAARDASARARALASALEKTRAETANLNAELRGEHRRKDDFLAMLAHELRNPLTPLVTAIELLRRQRGDGAAFERQVDIMARQVRQLSRLVEDLLDVSRVSRGRVELRRHPVPLRDCFPTRSRPRARCSMRAVTR